MPRRRVLVAQMSHETNTFNPVPTTLADFEACGLFAGPAAIERFRATDTELGGFIETLESAGVEVVGGIAASAIPSGPVAAEAYAWIEERILAPLADGPIDGVLLALHGAMVTADGEGAEATLLRRLRARAGRDTPIVCTLDLHTNDSEALCALATALVPYDTNPHVDQRQRGEEAATLLLRVFDERVQPVCAAARIPLLLSPLNQDTSRGPLAEVMAAARRHERDPGVLNVGVLPGFPFADVPTAGFSVVAVADGDRVTAERVARSVAEVAWGLRHRFAIGLPTAAEALDRAQGIDGGPVIIAEVADNVNAGASGDGTHLLAELLRRPVRGAVYAALADADAVAQALAAGVGQHAAVTLGGKASPLSGPPLTLTAHVRLASDGRYVNLGANNGAGMLKGFEVHMGRTVVLAVLDRDRDLLIVVAERRVPPIGPEMFRSLGIEPAGVRILAVKTRGHYWRPYPFVREILEANTPGLATPELARFPYRRVRRPIFPLDPME